MMDASYMSIKLSSIADPSVGIMDYISTRISAMPSVLRPTMPAGLSELRVQLPEGVVRKVTTAADTADGAAGDGGRDLSWAVGKMLLYVEKAQSAAGLVPTDGTKLLYVGDQLAMEDWVEPPMGKEKDKSAKDGSVKCKLCKTRICIANGGTARHMLGEVHLKNWVKEAGNDQVTVDDVRSLLNTKLTSSHKAGDSRSKRTTQYTQQKEMTANKAARTAATAAITAAFMGSPMPSMATLAGMGSPVPAMAAFAGSPAAAAAFQDALGGGGQ